MRQRGAGSVPHALSTHLYTDILQGLAKSRTLASISCYRVKTMRHLNPYNLSNQEGLERLHNRNSLRSDPQDGHQSQTKHKSTSHLGRCQPLVSRKSAAGQRKRRLPMKARNHLHPPLSSLMKELIRRRGRPARPKIDTGLL